MKPEKYASLFYTMIPEKTWNGYKRFDEFKQYANECGGQMADWVQWSLELAQRIDNGETWEEVCNKPDTVKWFRMIVGENKYEKIVGGSRIHGCKDSASYVHLLNNDYLLDSRTRDAVPLVVIKI